MAKNLLGKKPMRRCALTLEECAETLPALASNLAANSAWDVAD
jgi:hypothetical protein